MEMKALVRGPPTAQRQSTQHARLSTYLTTYTHLQSYDHHLEALKLIHFVQSNACSLNDAGRSTVHTAMIPRSAKYFIGPQSAKDPARTVGSNRSVQGYIRTNGSPMSIDQPQRRRWSLCIQRVSLSRRPIFKCSNSQPHRTPPPKRDTDA